MIGKPQWGRLLSFGLRGNYSPTSAKPSAQESLVPISQFNKGQAAKIFDRLHSEKELIVLKNNQPSAIILSPEEYIRLTEIEEDYFLLLEANKRIEENVDNKTISMDSVMNDLGISKEELMDVEDVDIE